MAVSGKQIARYPVVACYWLRPLPFRSSADRLVPFPVVDAPFHPFFGRRPFFFVSPLVPVLPRFAIPPLSNRSTRLLTASRDRNWCGNRTTESPDVRFVPDRRGLSGFTWFSGHRRAMLHPRSTNFIEFDSNRWFHDVSSVCLAERRVVLTSSCEGLKNFSGI